MFSKRWTTMAAAALLAGMGGGILAAPGRKPSPRKAAPTGAPSPGPGSASDAVLRLGRDEAALRSGRVSFLSLRREGELPAGASGLGVRTAAQQAPLIAQRREYHLFSGANWRRDITITDPQGNPSGHFLIGVNEKVGRGLQEVGHGEQLARNGLVGIRPDLDAADQILSGRSAALLADVPWNSRQQSGTQLILSGTRGSEKVTATLRTQPRYALEKLVRSSTAETPLGKVTQGQEVTVTYEVSGARLTPKTLEDLAYAAQPVGKVSLTTIKVEGAQLGEPVRPDELVISFPQGTQVTDHRFEPPLKYTQPERDYTQAELKALQEKQASAVVKVGSAAPGWELKSLEGKTVRLEEHRGKVVLLTWFASWCGPCHAEAPQMQKNVWEKYRDGGLVVVGINAGERDDPEKRAREFVEQHRLTYPVVLDTADEALEAYQVRAFPTLAIIDRKGVLRYLQAGFNEAAVKQQVEKLLAEKP